VSLSTGGWHGNTVSKGSTKALCIYVRAYSLFKSEHLSTNIKPMSYKAVIRSLMPVPPGSMQWMSLFETAVTAKHNTPRYWKSWRVHTNPWIACGYQNSLCVWLGRSNHKPCKSKCTWYWTREARHKKCKRLKLGGDQAYVHSADWLQFQSSYISSSITCHISLHLRETSVCPA
jgi:hypothetical protein